MKYFCLIITYFEVFLSLIITYLGMLLWLLIYHVLTSICTSTHYLSHHTVPCPHSSPTQVKSTGQQDTRDNCWRFFIDRVRKNLKMVLCFSPVGSTLRFDIIDTVTIYCEVKFILGMKLNYMSLPFLLYMSRVRARQFPAIISCTTIDWFHEWPQEALVSVSETFLSGIEYLPVCLILFMHYQYCQFFL